MPRYAPQMSINDFKASLVAHAKACAYEKNYDVIDPVRPDFDGIIHHCLGDGYLKPVLADWSEIDFDIENTQLIDDAPFRLLENGVPIVLLQAGGDWEFPVICAIYHDGSTFRGYVPADGNIFNTATKTAYGNDEAADRGNIQKLYGKAHPKLLAEENPHSVLDDYVDFDFDKVIADVEGRISARGTQGVAEPKLTLYIKDLVTDSEEEEEGGDTKDAQTGPHTNDTLYYQLTGKGPIFLQMLNRATKQPLAMTDAQEVAGIPEAFNLVTVHGVEHAGLWLYFGAKVDEAKALLKDANFLDEEGLRLATDPEYAAQKKEETNPFAVTKDHVYYDVKSNTDGVYVELRFRKTGRVLTVRDGMDVEGMPEGYELSLADSKKNTAGWFTSDIMVGAMGKMSTAGFVQTEEDAEKMKARIEYDGKPLDIPTPQSTIPVARTRYALGSRPETDENGTTHSVLRVRLVALGEDGKTLMGNIPEDRLAIKPACLTERTEFGFWGVTGDYEAVRQSIEAAGIEMDPRIRMWYTPAELRFGLAIAPPESPAPSTIAIQTRDQTLREGHTLYTRQLQRVPTCLVDNVAPGIWMLDPDVAIDAVISEMTDLGYTHDPALDLK